MVRKSTRELRFTVVYTVKDADGDTANTSYDLGANPVFAIQDSQTLVNNPNNNSAELSFDESFTIRNTDRHADDKEVDSKEEATFFDASKLFTITPGADDQGLKELEVEHHFSLNIVEQETDLQARYTSEDGTQLQGNIVLVQEADGSVTGRIETEGGQKVFTLTINKDSGMMTLAMEKGSSIFHENENLYDETATLAGKINVTLTVEDRDHDKSSAKAYVTLKFEDDGPALQMPQSASEITSTVSADGTTGTLSGIMTFDFGADGPAQEGAMTVTVMEGGIESSFQCVYDEATEKWLGSTEDGRTFTVSDSTGAFQYSHPISGNGDKDEDVSISVTIKDWDGDTITQTSWDRAPVIDVVVNDDSVKESGVAGCDRNLGNDPNVQYGGDKIASGTITLAQSDSNQTDSDTLTLSLWGGKITHTQLTPDPADDEDQTGEPDESFNISTGKLASGTTFYLVQGKDGPALLDSKEGGQDYYGTLTFSQDSDSGNWTWKFTLNEGKLTNSMTEKEEIRLDLNLGVSDGALKDDTGKLAITIKGTNDKPVFVVKEGDNELKEAGDAVVTDSDEAILGIATTVTGTLRGADDDTDNGAGSSEQEKNHLTFTVESLYSSAAGEVSTSDQENQYKPPYAEGSQEALNLLSSQIGGKGSGSDDGGDYTEITTTYGTLRVYADGEYVYTPNNTSQIGTDEYVTETFTVRVTDAHGSWTEKQITITLRDEDASVTDYEDVNLSAREEGVAGDAADPLPDNHDYNAHVPTKNPGTATLFRDEDVNDTLTLTAKEPSIEWERTDQALGIVFTEGGIEIGVGC